MTWRVRILGTVSVEGPSFVDRFPTKRAALLLIRLAFAQGRSVYRDSLCRDLWPDDPLDATRARLRQELSRLNNALGSARDIVIANRLSMRIDTAQATIDLKEAENLLSRAAVEEDRDNKRHILKEFAPYALDVAPGYEEPWIEAVREDWRNRTARTLIALAQSCADKDMADEALAYAKTAANYHLLSESIQAAYLQLLARLGRPNEARTHLAELNGIYRTVLGAGPTENLRRRAGLESRPSDDRLDSESRAILKRLPARLAGFVGRRSETREVIQNLQPGPTYRLCTLTGPGGIGKTELALEAGRELLHLYKDRVWFVPLAGVDSPRFIPAAIRDSMGIAPAEADPFESVAESIADQPSLLILDNLEQLIDGGAQIVRRLLEVCPRLSLLVTSRRRLRVEGEQEFSVPALSSEHAVELFCQIAKRSRPGFQIEEKDLEAVREIVEMIDRLPLAIQLAASRASVLSPREMLDQLSKRFDLLVSRRLDIEPRHRTLRQTIAWTYDQLSAEAQRFLLDLSLFRGGCTLALAEEVLENPRSLTLLEELSDHSLVTATPQDGETRFNLLHSIREFAMEKQDPNRAERQLQKMADVLVKLSTAASKQLLEEDQELWYGRLEREHENIRRVLQFAAEHDAELGVSLCAKLWRFWTNMGHHVEAKGWFERLLPTEAAPFALMRVALFGAARCAYEQGELDLAEQYYLRTLDAYDREGENEWYHGVKANLAEVYLSRREFEKARELLLESMEKGRFEVTSYLWALWQDGIAAILIEMEEFEEASERLNDAIERLSGYYDQVAVANAYLTQGRLLVRTDQYEPALSRLTEALTIYENFRHLNGIGMVKQVLAELALRQGRLEDVERLCAESAGERLVIRDRFGLGHVSLILAEAAKRRSDDGSSAKHLAQAAKHFRACGCEGVPHGTPYQESKR